ncbi:unnamed protein product [Amoebophrya sp. A120]|nr:unnamed protein product [Amoebophrya sp. A120]|eukprot:GSA120T00003393001.1
MGSELSVSMGSHNQRAMHGLSNGITHAKPTLAELRGLSGSSESPAAGSSPSRKRRRMSKSATSSGTAFNQKCSATSKTGASGSSSPRTQIPAKLPPVTVKEEYRGLAEILHQELDESQDAALQIQRQEEENTLSSRPELRAQYLEVAKKALLDYANEMDRVWEEVRQEYESIFDVIALKCGLVSTAARSSLIGMWCDDLDCLPTAGTEEQQFSLSVRQRTSIGEFLIAARNFQRSRQILRKMRKGEWDDPLLQELKETGWSDLEQWPEVLAFEVQNDLRVRALQERIAVEFVTGTESRLLEYSMGLGKTSVIMAVVLLLSSRKGTECLPRAIVLGSQLATNAKDWQHKLGGWLRRRLVPLFFRRDHERSADELAELLSDLRELRTQKGVLVMAPADCMSLKNKVIELVAGIEDADASPGAPVGQQKHRGDEATLAALTEIFCLLEDETRDYLDESDEILAPRTQLMYTIGKPRTLAKGEERYRAAMDVLRFASELGISYLQDERFGPDVVHVDTAANEEIIRRKSQTSAFFLPWRLLDHAKQDECYEQLKKDVASRVCKDEIAPRFRYLDDVNSQYICEDFKAAVLEKDPTEHLARLPDDETRDLARIYCGLLSHEVLRTVLVKRHWVEYGAHLGRPSHRMAVPFAAKGKPAERTEYAHPDTGIMLTVAHYYHRGLEEDQLREVFDDLQCLPDHEGARYYDKWMEVLGDHFYSYAHDLQHLHQINLDDQLCLRKVVKVFSKSMAVVDFFLSKRVFPKEARQFPRSIRATAGDLVKDPHAPGSKGVTLGFAGTDDLKVVAPPTIEQRNLPGLATKGLQLLRLRQKANSRCEELATGKDVTAQVLQLLGGEFQAFDVLLDGGALILDQSSRDFCAAWLKLRETTGAKAAVFFDEKHQRRVLFRSGIEMAFSESPYVASMKGCLLYISDENLRGSNFDALPPNCKCAVTLGKGMTFDKLRQTCFRARQVGRGQIVNFIAAAEVAKQLDAVKNADKVKKEGDMAKLTRTMKSLDEMIEDDGDADGSLTKKRDNCRRQLEQLRNAPASASSAGTVEQADLDVKDIDAVLQWARKNTVEECGRLMGPLVSQSALCIRKSRLLRNAKAEAQAQDSNLASFLELYADAGVETEKALLSDLYGNPRNPEKLTLLTQKRLRHEIQNHDPIAEKLLDRVNKVAPNLAKPGHRANCSDQHERELEQELEEERDVEESASMQPTAPQVSSGLSDLAEWLKQPGNAGKKYGDFSQVAFVDLPRTLGRSTSEITVLATLDFACTLAAPGCDPFAKAAKMPEFVLEIDTDPGGKVALLVSNFEAEQVFGWTGAFGPLRLFAPTNKAEQRPRTPRDLALEKDGERPELAALHLFAGSLFPGASLLESMREQLTAVPDGPAQLRHFLQEVRGLAAELPTSTVGAEFLRFQVDQDHPPLPGEAVEGWDTPALFGGG